MTEPNSAHPLNYRADNDDNERGLIEIFQSNPKLRLGVGIALIALATLVAYVPAIRGQFIWDDNYYVTHNPLLRSVDGLQRIWFDIFSGPATYPLPQYYPMTHTTFWVEYRLWRLNSTGYHLTNVLLHICNALLIWLILRRLDVPGAFAAAAIFALHPMNVESVAWIAERKNVLCAFFFFSSLYVYLRYSRVIAKPQAANATLSLPDDLQRVLRIGEQDDLEHDAGGRITADLVEARADFVEGRRRAAVALFRTGHRGGNAHGVDGSASRRRGRA
jgi:hypothetical protein